VCSPARFGVADVRDVADLHIRAMAAPGGAGQRFLAVADGPALSYLEVAQIRRAGTLTAWSVSAGDGDAGDHRVEPGRRRECRGAQPGRVNLAADQGDEEARRRPVEALPDQVVAVPPHHRPGAGVAA
jgi:nucleoside-diphosphate-sugar epimerase